MKRVTLQMVAMIVLGVCTGGCEPTVSTEKFDRLNQQWIDSQRESRDLTRRYQELEETVGRQNEQIAILQNLGDKRLEKLFYVTSLEMGRRSGGVDKVGQDGDDAVIVYLQPVDADGHVIKAAGDVTVQLYDLANPPAENLIGEFHWPVEEMGKTWAGGFLGSSHFSLLCPWPAGPPAHNQITVRATFTDYLTGKTFTAQKIVSVHLPGAAPTPAPPAPESEPASAPTPASPATQSQPASAPSSEQAN
ncbi:MAG: hypothetical protein MUP47_04165 [Phycisphaerae bacterium]|nr:hypothetical protein [Phycisphaerae bacterium]